jgi:hypothetical protein
MPKITVKAVYWVEELNKPPEERPINPLAINPVCITGGDCQIIEWYDTARGSRFTVSKLSINPEEVENEGDETPDQIHLTTDQERHIVLHKLTKELFKTNIEQSVAGTLDFDTDEEYQNYFMETLF